MTKRWCVWMCAGALALAACGQDAGPEEAEGRGPVGGKADIIGEDDRRDEFSGDVSDELRAIARATAMVIERPNVGEPVDGKITLAGDRLGDFYYMCPDERFADQPATGMCSAWLVAPDIMVSNGHCITSQADCEQKSFVFDYAITEEGGDPNVVPEANVVACEQVLAWDNSSFCDVDFAVFKLERPVTDREPVKVRGPEEELAGDDLVIIGHPFGLPRKYALNGDVIEEGDNGFITTHDIFGGNSGSAIFDAKSGAVQGIMACGGSNLQWENWEGDWQLERKTGRACDETCDGAGEYVDGSLEPASLCGEGGFRRRCVCDGEQLVWEARECLPFEAETDGTCSRENSTSEFTCTTAPWLCATPYAQHTNTFAMFVDQWDVLTGEGVDIPANGETVTVSLGSELEGVLQATTLSLDLIDALGQVDPFLMTTELEVRLVKETEEGEVAADLVLGGTAYDGTAFGLGMNAHSDTQAFMVPFIVNEFHGEVAAGDFRLEITNFGGNDYTLQGWKVSTITKPTPEDAIRTSPCVVDCASPYKDWPEDFHEPFDGRGVELEGVEGVEGTIDDEWGVEVWDPRGEAYEVYKTRKSQTMAMTRGEFALVRDFAEDIGGRDLTIDYRYDGEGWFQIWADGQILYTDNSFTQQAVTVPLPASATRIQFVLGATDGSRDHELTLYDMILSAPSQSFETAPDQGSCGDGEAQYSDLNGELFCIQIGCTQDADCAPNHVCGFDEAQGINLCYLACNEDADCAEGQACAPLDDAGGICGWR